MRDSQYQVLEICAGAGGQASGLEQAGFHHALAVEIDKDAAATLRLNRPNWMVVQDDVRNVKGSQFEGIALLAGGVPCPPFSVAGKQLGADDERDLFPEALRLVDECKPQAVMLENVKGLASSRFKDYREAILRELFELGYSADWRLVNSSDYGVPQLRPRFILVAMPHHRFAHFDWPTPVRTPPTVGEALYHLMAQNGWPGAKDWAERAGKIAPTIVGGSRKHGGADLGPTRAKQAWLELGVDGKGIADEAPPRDAANDFVPRLTNAMAARLQGFDPSWRFSGRKTSTYRQIGNAFPPPVAAAIGRRIMAALEDSAAAQGVAQQDPLAVHATNPEG